MTQHDPGALDRYDDAPDRPYAIDKGAAMLNYGFLIVSPFTLGFLAIVALVLAYARRGGADPITRTHYDHQIRSFWKDFVILLLGLVCAIGAIATGLGTLAAAAGVPLPNGVQAGNAGLWTIGFAIGWLVFWVWGILGLLFGSILGALRLAGSRPIRH